MPRALASQTRAKPQRLRGARAFPRTPSFFSTRNRAGGCCRRRKLTFTRGSTASLRRDFARVFIAPAFRRRMTATWSPQKTFGRAPENARSFTGPSTMHVPPRRDADFQRGRRSPAASGVSSAEVWQFAQSPQRKDVAGHCTNYSRDGNCYPPGTGAAQGLHIDVNTAASPDPSQGRTR